MAENKQAPGTDERAAPEVVYTAPAPELTADEAVVLEAEGRAALFEMGESLPDAPGAFDTLPHEAPDHVVSFTEATEKAAPGKKEKAEKPAPEAAADMFIYIDSDYKCHPRQQMRKRLLLRMKFLI